MEDNVWNIVRHGILMAEGIKFALQFSVLYQKQSSMDLREEGLGS